ncbi:hypothetical protein BDV97DRAFT_353976 [Delphinella strobiligena]|nr:hypothetical protein BDV97DRAFT_353976 [Delphinella strobiligena]
MAKKRVGQRVLVYCGPCNIEDPGCQLICSLACERRHLVDLKCSGPPSSCCMTKLRLPRQSHKQATKPWPGFQATVSMNRECDRVIRVTGPQHLAQVSRPYSRLKCNTRPCTPVCYDDELHRTWRTCSFRSCIIFKHLAKPIPGDSSHAIRAAMPLLLHRRGPAACEHAR